MVQVALEGALFTSSMHLSFTLYSCLRYPDLMMFHIDFPSFHISIKWHTQILTSSCAALAIWYGVCVAEPCSNSLQSVLDMLVVLFSGSSLGRFSLSQEKKQRFISFIETHLFCNTDGGLWSLIVCILLDTTCCTYSTKCENIEPCCKSIIHLSLDLQAHKDEIWHPNHGCWVCYFDNRYLDNWQWYMKISQYSKYHTKRWLRNIVR